MNKLLLRSLVLIAVVIFFITPAFAVKKSGTPTKYIVKLKTVKLLNGDGAWITVFDGISSPLDIASVSSGANQLVGDFLNGLNVPDGTYTQAKVQPDATFTIKGIVDGYATDGGTIYPNNINPDDDEWACTSKLEGTEGTPADCTLTITDKHAPEEQGPWTFDPIVVKNGVADRKIRVSFTVADAVTDIEATHYIYPDEPTIEVVSIAK